MNNSNTKTKTLHRKFGSLRLAAIICAAVVQGGVPALAQAPDVLSTALSAHGGTALLPVMRVRMAGVSLKEGNSEPLTISAELDGRGSGSVRFDYGQPLARTYIGTPKGVAEVRAGQKPLHYPGHIGAFSQLDILSAVGVQHLTAVGVQRSVPVPTVVSGRASVAVRAVTEKSKTAYSRLIADDVTVQVDQATGLVAEITRRQFAERNLDISFLAGYRFSDYRRVDNVMMPYRIDRVLDGSVRESIVLQTVEINPAFPSDLFRVVDPKPQQPRR